jgi:small GTP-binding protein
LLKKFLGWFLVGLSDAMKPGMRANIVLVGSTGHGKSTLGNYLLNFGEKQVFEEGETGLSCTQSSSAAQVVFSGTTFNVIDTPGLNEAEAERDLKNMLGVHQFCAQEKLLSLVVLVVKANSRLDKQCVETFRYYLELFRPLKDLAQFAVIFTAMSRDDYDDLLFQHRVDDWKENRKKEIEGLLDVKIPFVLLINSKPPLRVRQQYLEALKSGKAIDDSIHSKSPLVRNTLFTLAVGLPLVDVTQHLFPLPPSIEVLRISLLDSCNKEIAEMLATVKVHDELNALVLNNIQRLDGSVAQTDREILEQRACKVLLEQTQYEGPKVLGDNDILHILDRKMVINFGSPLKEYETMCDVHNCTATWSRDDSGARGAAVCNIKTDIFAWTSARAAQTNRDDDEGQEYKWYARAWLEFSGREYNKDKICYVEKKISELIVTVTRAREEATLLKKQQSDKSQEQSQLQASLDSLTKMRTNLERPLFTLDGAVEAGKTLLDYKSKMQK